MTVAIPTFKFRAEPVNACNQLHCTFQLLTEAEWSQPGQSKRLTIVNHYSHWPFTTHHCGQWNWTFEPLLGPALNSRGFHCNLGAIKEFTVAKVRDVFQFSLQHCSYFKCHKQNLVRCIVVRPIIEGNVWEWWHAEVVSVCRYLTLARLAIAVSWLYAALQGRLTQDER